MSERNISMDIAKGICIILMIIVHFFSWWEKYEVFNKYVGVFFLVFFFVASGFFFKTPTEKKSYIKKRAKKLLIPYIATTTIYLLYRFFYVKGYVENDIIETIKMIFVSLITALPMEFKNISLFNVDTVGIGPIWFFNCLFVTNIIYILIDKSRYKFIISIILAVLGQVSQNFVILPFNIQDALIGCMFFAIGNCGKDKIVSYINFLKEKDLNIDFVICILQVILYGFTINMLPHQWMNLGGNSYDIISIISSILGMSILMNISIIIEKTQIINVFLEKYGKNSAFILIIHSIDILMIRNWKKCTWEFLVATILGYYFINYIKNSIVMKFNKKDGKIKNIKLLNN